MYPLLVYRMLPKSWHFSREMSPRGKISVSHAWAQQRQNEWMFIIHVKWKDSGRTTCPVLKSYVTVLITSFPWFFFQPAPPLSEPGQAFCVGGLHLSCAWWVGYCAVTDFRQRGECMVYPLRKKANSRHKLDTEWMKCWSSFIYIYDIFIQLYILYHILIYQSETYRWMYWQGAVSEHGSSQITGDAVMTDKPLSHAHIHRSVPQRTF